MEGEIINRVANSGILTFNPEDYRPKGERLLWDIKDQLFMGMILKEKDFREFIKNHDWNQYTGKYIALTCSVDAIVPTWAYMLLTVQLQPVARKVIFGTLEQLELELLKDTLNQINLEELEGKRVVIKGCGGITVAEYVEITNRLRPYAQSIMYGEPCSSVPLYKKSNIAKRNEETVPA